MTLLRLAVERADTLAAEQQQRDEDERLGGQTSGGGGGAADGRRLHFTGVSPYTNRQELVSYFQRYGEVKSVDLIKAPSSSSSTDMASLLKRKGFGFVTFSRLETAKVALEQAAPHVLGEDRETLVVSAAKPRRRKLSRRKR
jgi:RNA recognition motif-containing protein